MPQKIIELRVESNKIQIKAPYEGDLVDDIKGIPKEQRKWEDPFWVIDLHDPNQSPNLETNLAYLQRICQENANRLGWKFVDYSGKSSGEIKQEEAKSQEELIDEFLAVVDELPQGALKLVRWDTDKLQLQLNYYLSDEVGGYELFMRLFHASQQAYKPGLLLSSEQRADFGFIFEVPYRLRVVLKLCQKGTTYLKRHYDLVAVKIFEDGVVHFLKGDESWFGIPMSKCDPSSINWQSQSWELAQINEELYWVCETKKFVTAWTSATKYGVANFGGAYGIIYERPEQLSNRVKTFHLEKWLENYILELAQSPVKCTSAAPWNYRPSAWVHPLDSFMDKVAIAADIRNTIEAQKIEKAHEAIERDRANAPQLAINKLNAYTKAEILAKYGNKTQFQKSWTKARILELLCTQQFAEELLGIPVQQEV